MPYEFETDDGVLEKYHGREAHVVIPEGVTEIESMAFTDCGSLISVVIPDGVKKIGSNAFMNCGSLTSVDIPDSVTEIGAAAFMDCVRLTAIRIPDSVTEIGKMAFRGCKRLADSEGFIIFEDELHAYCGSAASVTIPDGVKVIRDVAFLSCGDMTSVRLPGSVRKIGGSAFRECANLTSVTIPDGVKEIGYYAFFCCERLTSIILPESVTEISPTAFSGCPKLTVICREGSYAERFCSENDISYIFDFQFKAFNGLLPQGFEKLSSPFLADEEKPYVFISYSHRDRDTVLPILKALYESGWRIWYDEGLTIGDRYDETLEEHIRDCSALLLFASGNSLVSRYCRENEIPWAIGYGRPIVRCLLDEEGIDFEIPGNAVAETVSPSDIEAALEGIAGLGKGERRTAKGISVVVDPADREAADGDGFAYCLYAGGSATVAKAILYEAGSSGCTLYDAVENGADKERLRTAACLVVFLDRAFLSDEDLTETLIGEHRAGRDIAVCQLEDFEDEDLPEELHALHSMHWLNFAYGIDRDMNTKLARHLQKRGCRNTAVLPGFGYEKTDGGIVIGRYRGMDPAPRIESGYGGIPVTEIADRAFRNCIHLTSLVIPDGVTRIGAQAFEGCGGLTSIVIPGSVREIGKNAFHKCGSLTSVVIPHGVTKIGEGAFSLCGSLTSAVLPETVTEIPKSMFSHCGSLTSITIPDSVREIGGYAFYDCGSLASIVIPDGVTKTGDMAFGNCDRLADGSGLVIVNGTVFSCCGSASSIVIPDTVTRIGAFAFSGCKDLTSVVIPDSVTEIGLNAFQGCDRLAVTVSRDTPAWRYCSYNRIPSREPRSVSTVLKRIGRRFGRK